VSSYKKLFYKSQSEIADAIDNIEKILSALKKCMIECEDEVMLMENRIINIENKIEIISTELYIICNGYCDLLLTTKFCA